MYFVPILLPGSDTILFVVPVSETMVEKWIAEERNYIVTDEKSKPKCELSVVYFYLDLITLL